MAQVDELGGVQTSGLVLAGDAWHPGVVGIVASRVVERFGRPTFLVAFDGETGRASGRSISRFDLHAALVQCGDLLERFGGHHMAAGLTIRRDRLDAFRERFNALVAGKLTPEELGPEQRVDIELPRGQASETGQVTGEVTTVQSESSALGSVISEKTVRAEAPVGNGHLKGISRTVRRAWPVSGSAGPTGCLAGRRAGGRGVPPRERRLVWFAVTAGQAGFRHAVGAASLRIIGGRFGGRRLTAPADPRVRPTADRVREAWMSILSDALPGARVLDLFAGSGALGLEALSRGASSVDFVDIGPRSIAALKANIESLGVELARVHRADALRYAARLAPLSYDIAFADPPYTIETAATDLAEAFRTTPFARILAVEHAASVDLGGDQSRRYGDTTITFCYAP